MKRVWRVRALLLIIYCVPFAFLAVHGDAVSGTMAFYGVMAMGLAALCRCALKTKNIAILCAGNLASFLSSRLASVWTGLEPMGDYFKPFTSYALIACISVFALVIQLIVVSVFVVRKKKKEADSAALPK